MKTPDRETVCAPCKSKIVSESGTDNCERKSGHKGWHWYHVRLRRMIMKVSWRRK